MLQTLCAPEPNFLMTRNGRKMAIFEVTIRLGESDFNNGKQYYGK